MADGNLSGMAAALAAPDGQPEAAFEALCDLSRTIIGHRLFTLMTFDMATHEARRTFSNMPDAYPVSGRKQVEENGWTRQVIGEGRTFAANTIEAIADVFPDYELIRSLGCESVINVPIVVAGRFLGTINCLDAAGHYTAERIAASEALKLPGAACFLLQHTIDQGGL